MLEKSNGSLIPSVVREFGVLLLVVLFASTPFFAAQAQENRATSLAPLYAASSGQIAAADAYCCRTRS